ncbi:uncharacterized protein BYT42DRAFT_585856 [Radiomyces spectabilis]|uniref:uncharacterized protein n=1 Tax=Radiomyces spectabilis TaxID=64574 RepID=UPI002220D386|nr:uncharacterized protein BYT42DRAFT_585856 [Radiomyces spectabilis]KAI8368236.1 hypothetical protein BYT42DRAFT_585856 [Radiomyces spectabilis]
MDSHIFIATAQPDGGELAAQLVCLFSVSILSTLFGVKTFNVQFTYLSYSRWLVLALYVCSWAFCVSSIVLISTNNNNYLSCMLSIMACDIFYSGTKLVMYSWLTEKVWVVSSVRQSRWRTKSYRFHVILMTPYIAIFTLMLIFHIAEITETGICIIGLQPVASIPLLVYDFVFNLYMTILFIKPLVRIGKGAAIDWRNSRLHDVAQRTLVASVVCLVVSFANVFTLILFGGRERGLLCLTCCAVDVVINVATIHWVTTNPAGKTAKDSQTVDDSNHYTAQAAITTTHSTAAPTKLPPRLRQDSTEYNFTGDMDRTFALDYAYPQSYDPVSKYVTRKEQLRFASKESDAINEKVQDTDDMAEENRSSFSRSGSHNSRFSLTKTIIPSF